MENIHTTNGLEKTLVQFGNFLFSEQRDSMTSETNKKSVTDADLRNFEYEMSKSLPSAHQIGDQVNVELQTGTYFNGHVTKVSFLKGKINYDVQVKFIDEQVEKSEAGPDIDEAVTTVETKITREKSVRLYNLDSVYVNKSIIKGDLPYEMTLEQRHLALAISKMENGKERLTAKLMEDNPDLEPYNAALEAEAILGNRTRNTCPVSNEISINDLAKDLGVSAPGKVDVSESDITNTQRNVAVIQSGALLR